MDLKHQIKRVNRINYAAQWAMMIFVAILCITCIAGYFGSLADYFKSENPYDCDMLVKSSCLSLCGCSWCELGTARSNTSIDTNGICIKSYDTKCWRLKTYKAPACEHKMIGFYITTGFAGVFVICIIVSIIVIVNSYAKKNLLMKLSRELNQAEE